MAENEEKKRRLILTEEEFRKASQLLKAKESPLDTEGIKGNLPKEMPEFFKKS